MPLESLDSPVVTTPCVLCGRHASREVTDCGRRLLFRCSNDACGEYEITLRALHRLTTQAQKQAFRDLVHRIGADPERIVEIVVAGNHQPTATAVPRRAALKPAS